MEMPVPMAPADGEDFFVTFTEYVPYGWVGYCSVVNCEGVEPRGI